MEKIKVGILTVILFLININNVSAACDFTETDELNKLASNVKVSYEVVEKEKHLEEGDTPPDSDGEVDFENFTYTYYVLKVYIENVNEKIYVSVYNDLTDEDVVYTYEDSKNGTIEIEYDFILLVQNLTFTIYSSDATNCSDQKLFNHFLTLPRYNDYSEYGVCDGIEDFYMCYEWLTVGEPDFNEFLEAVTNYKKELEATENEDTENDMEENLTFLEFIKKYKFMVIGVSIGVLAIGTTVIVILVKRNRRKEL